jgi:hypothetical protein
MRLGRAARRGSASSGWKVLATSRTYADASWRTRDAPIARTSAVRTAAFASARSVRRREPRTVVRSRVRLLYILGDGRLACPLRQSDDRVVVSVLCAACDVRSAGYRGSRVASKPLPWCVLSFGSPEWKLDASAGSSPGPALFATQQPPVIPPWSGWRSRDDVVRAVGRAQADLLPGGARARADRFAGRA